MITVPATLLLPVAAPLGGAFGHDVIQMVLNAGLMVKFVLLVLLLFSVVSWSIILLKFWLIRKATRESRDFLVAFWETRDWKRLFQASKDLKYGPIPYLFVTGYSEFSRMRRIEVSAVTKDNPEPPGAEASVRSQHTVMDNLERSLKKGLIDQTDRLERALSFLATTGNTAPFIGLFGTVWGIMEAFRGIGLRGSANLAVVAPGISEALIATAAGLAAAIPAVIAFNHFSHRISALRAHMDIFTSDFLMTVERQYFRRQVVGKSDI